MTLAASYERDGAGSTPTTRRGLRQVNASRKPAPGKALPRVRRSASDDGVAQTERLLDREADAVALARADRADDRPAGPVAGNRGQVQRAGGKQRRVEQETRGIGSAHRTDEPRLTVDDRAKLHRLHVQVLDVEHHG